MRSSKEKNKDDRKPRNERKTQKIDEPEVPVPRFMTEQQHAQQPADRPAEKRQQKQNFFGNAPPAAARLPLVRAVYDESCKAHRAVKGEHT